MMDEEKQHLMCLRGADDLRRGQMVLLQGRAESSQLVLPLEKIDHITLPLFEACAGARGFIALTQERAITLNIAHKGDSVVLLDRPVHLDMAGLIALADPTQDLSLPFKGPFHRREDGHQLPLDAAVKLLKIAHLLPACLVAEIEKDRLIDPCFSELLRIKAAAVQAFDVTQASLLQEVARAAVPLLGAEKTEMIAFRPTAGGLEHIAVKIGDPPAHRPVLVRLHSECFTGDLLASLKCDCGDQLRGAIRRIASEGGGVLLYMAQEGRGIGLISKLKAYALQEQGYDTVDANIRLGFGVDERAFAPAAEMLKMLGYKRVRLMTNNPGKIEALEAFGLEVVERIHHEFGPNPHNEQYLDVKKTRTGHMLRGIDDT